VISLIIFGSKLLTICNSFLIIFIIVIVVINTFLTSFSTVAAFLLVVFLIVLLSVCVLYVTGVVHAKAVFRAFVYFVLIRVLVRDIHFLSLSCVVQGSWNAFQATVIETSAIVFAISPHNVELFFIVGQIFLVFVFFVSIPVWIFAGKLMRLIHVALFFKYLFDNSK